MKKRICSLLVIVVMALNLTGCRAMDVVLDILSVNTADTESDHGAKIEISNPTATESTTEETPEMYTHTPTPTEEPKNVIYCSSPVNVRSEANGDSQIIDSLTIGQEVEKIGEEGTWIHIRYSNVEGWVYGKYMTEQKG